MYGICPCKVLAHRPKCKEEVQKPLHKKILCINGGINLDLLELGHRFQTIQLLCTLSKYCSLVVSGKY